MPYYVSVVLFVSGIYISLSDRNYIQKIIGLVLLQLGVLVFFISLGKLFNALPPIYVNKSGVLYSNPLPHVLMLTAIVVGFATFAVALSLIIRIFRTYNSVDENDIIN